MCGNIFMYAGDREIKISCYGDNNMAVIIQGRTMREDRKKIIRVYGNRE